MSHTPEPWIVNGWIRIESEHEHGFVNDGWIIGDLDGPDAKENARRIVACVNACKGISTKTLEHANAHREKLNGINTAYEIAAKERDTYRDLCVELLKTLRITESWLEGWASAESELSQTRAAITKAEKLLGEKNGTSN